MRQKLLALLFVASLAGPALSDDIAEPSVTITDRVMQSTVRLKGTGVTASGILIQVAPTVSILVTSASSIKGMKGNELNLGMRRRSATGWTFASVTVKVTDFLAAQADVAAMPVQLPAEVMPEAVVTFEMLADDAVMQRHGVATGHEAFLVGYPLGLLANEEGFGLLRSAHIANYPFYPTHSLAAIVLDRELVEGESGAPVFVTTDEGAGFVIGIVGEPWESSTMLSPVTVVPSSVVRPVVEAAMKRVRGEGEPLRSSNSTRLSMVRDEMKRGKPVEH